MGTYAQPLNSEGAGLYKIAELNSADADYLSYINDIVSEREKATILVCKLLGERAQEWVDQNDTLHPLITAFQNLSNCQNDSRSPILYAGNAFESFLVKLATHHSVSLTGATGINAKIDAIARANFLNTKYKFIGKYLGHVRNACDHGIDTEIGQAWNVCPETSREYVRVTITCIKNIVESLNGNFCV